jgi:CRISPR-associated protein Cas8b1/Cst1 subtype I-B
MYKIDIKDEDSEYNIEDLLDTYKKYLDEDLIKLLEKLKETKPDTITDEEREMILNNTLYYEGLSESLGDLLRTIDNDNDNEDTNE